MFPRGGNRFRLTRSLFQFKRSRFPFKRSRFRADGSMIRVAGSRAGAFCGAGLRGLGVIAMPRGGSNYIPRPDGVFNAWSSQYATSVKDWWSLQGLEESQIEPLSDARAAFAVAFAAHVRAQAAAESARAAKDAARAALEMEVRWSAAFVQSYPATTDAQRATMGITVRDTTRTPSPTPMSRPLVSVEPAARLTHELRLVDDASPTQRGKPVGVVGAEVWVTLVNAGSPPPRDPAALSFLMMATRPTVRAAFTSADGGKTAVYMLRWVSTRGEKGPWSDVVTGTVAA